MDNRYMFDSYYKKSFIDQIELVQKYYDTKNITLHEIELDNLLKKICLFNNMPQFLIDKIILKNDMTLYSELIWNKFILTYNLIDIKAWNHSIFSKTSQIGKDKNNYFSVYCVLDEKYTSLPSIELFSENSAYIIHKWIPYFITKNKNWLCIEDDWEVSWQTLMTKDLNILLGCILLAANLKCTNIHLWERLNVMLSDDVDYNNINDVVEDIKENKYIYEMIYGLHSNVKYNFSNKITEEWFLTFLNVIDRDNHIFLKVLSYVYKSSLLAYNRTFYEESMWLILFALEWILKLLMEKYWINKVADIIPFLNKEFWLYDISDFIDELYDIRIEYVHAINNISDDWYLDTSIHYWEVSDIVWALIEIYLLENKSGNYEY